MNTSGLPQGAGSAPQGLWTALPWKGLPASFPGGALLPVWGPQLKHHAPACPEEAPSAGPSPSLVSFAVELTAPGGSLRFFAAHLSFSLSAAVLTPDPPVLLKSPRLCWPPREPVGTRGPRALGNVSRAPEDPGATFYLVRDFKFK